jgi:hypothetical protein
MLYSVINATLHLKLRNFTPLPHGMFWPQRTIIRCLVMLKLLHCIKCLFIHTMCKCDVSCLIYLMYSVLTCLDQFCSLSNLILILKFHKIILPPLLGALSACPKQSSLYSSIWSFYYSCLGVAFFHTPVVCYRFLYLMLLTSPPYDNDVCLCVDVILIFLVEVQIILIDFC